MSFLARNSRLAGAALAATIGLAAISATPARADGWIQFGFIAPTLAPPPPVIVAPPPPPPPPTVYGYAYRYPYSYPTPYAYAVPSYSYAPYYARHWHRWRPVRDRDDWDDD